MALGAKWVKGECPMRNSSRDRLEERFLTKFQRFYKKFEITLENRKSVNPFTAT